jgi:hypothetical protein
MRTSITPNTFAVFEFKAYKIFLVEVIFLHSIFFQNFRIFAYLECHSALCPLNTFYFHIAETPMKIRDCNCHGDAFTGPPGQLRMN